MCSTNTRKDGGGWNGSKRGDTSFFLGVRYSMKFLSNPLFLCFSFLSAFQWVSFSLPFCISRKTHFYTITTRTRTRTKYSKEQFQQKLLHYYYYYYYYYYKGEQTKNKTPLHEQKSKISKKENCNDENDNNAFHDSSLFFLSKKYSTQYCNINRHTHTQQRNGRTRDKNMIRQNSSF